MSNERREAAIAALAPYIERARNFSGWSIKGVATKHLDAREPWDYEAMAHQRAGAARRVLDLGTGGGEVLSRVCAGSSARFVATEEWHVNAPVAHDRLRPLGIDVLRARSLMLPLRDGAFDVELDRHEELEPAEIARVLAPGGTAMTQQVGPDNWRELGAFFPRKEDFGDHFRIYREGFEASGLRIADARWHEERVAFGSIGDIAFMLLIAPWYVPNFDPVAEIDTLLAVEDALRTEDGIVLMETRYIIVAGKPG